MPVQTQWFKDRLAERRMSQRALARSMGLDSAAVSLMFRGRREMKISEAVEIAQLLGRPADEVMEAAGVAIRDHGAHIPIAGYADGQGEIHSIAVSERTYIAHPGGDLPPEVTATRCQTAGTPIDYMDGWLLFSEEARPGVPADAVGRLSLCQISHGVVYLAKPTRGDRRGAWNLNGPAASARNVSIDWATPVLLIQT